MRNKKLDLGDIMNAYAVVSHFREDIPEQKEVMKILKEHLKYFAKCTEEGKVLIAGPHALENGSFGGGGVMVLKTNSKKEAANDPFVTGNIVDYTIYEFKVVNLRPELEEWFKS